MFVEYTEFDNEWTIVDSDFTEKVHAKSLWNAIVDVYRAKGLNEYANLAVALKDFLPPNQNFNEGEWTYNHFIDEFFPSIGIDGEKVRPYLMLV